MKIVSYIMLHVIIWMTAAKVAMWNGNRILYKVYGNGIQSSVLRESHLMHAIDSKLGVRFVLTGGRRFKHVPS